MSKIHVFHSDDQCLEFDSVPSGLEVAQRIGSQLAKEAVGFRIFGNKEIFDIRSPVEGGWKIQIISLKDPEANEVIRHSAAHVMAQAVQQIWPGVKVTIGPVIDNGFYYDFDADFSFTEKDFDRIEQEMKKIIASDLPLRREEWHVDRAIQVFKDLGETFKVEIIEDLKREGQQSVTVYYQGNWFDLCRGPHVQSTGQIKAFKLLSVAGAYWRGDEKNKMLQRIYATAFRTQEELDEYLTQLEEAKKRDHRKLGKELDLFYFHEWAPGAPFFTSKGSIIYLELQNFLRELYIKYGYQEVITPQLFDVELFKTSGHWANYRENMYFVDLDHKQSAIKPMNCPSHCLLYASQLHSYRELPIRYADFGRLHRHERAGTMHGLFRVRSFCQDDAHIFCTPDQLQGEIAQFMQFLNEVYRVLGMNEFHIYLSTRPEKRMGTDALWDQAEGALEKALRSLNYSFTVNPGDGAFYGPKLDIMFVDSLKRLWQLGTLQVDFNLPQAFNLYYVGEDNAYHRPVILHRAILGSFERFIGVYLEHVAGHLPPWLCPIQVAILSVTDRVRAFCLDLKQKFMENGIRVLFDDRNEKLSFKIREAQISKIPYMIIVGDRESQNQQVTLRLRTGVDKGTYSVEQALFQIKNHIYTRQCDL